MCFSLQCSTQLCLCNTFNIGFHLLHNAIIFILNSMLTPFFMCIVLRCKVLLWKGTTINEILLLNYYLYVTHT